MKRIMMASGLSNSQILSAEEEWEVVEKMNEAYDLANRLTEESEKTGKSMRGAIGRARMVGDGFKARLVLAHIRFATFMAAKYRDSNWTIDELVSEAYTLMTMRAPRFRNRKGRRFINYVGFQVKYRLLIVQGLGGEIFAMGRKKEVSIRPAPLRPSEAVTKGTVLDSIEEMDPSSREQKVLSAYRSLRPNSQEALRLCLGLDSGGERTLRGAAKDLGLSYSGLRKVRDIGLRKLREAVEE